MGWPISDRAKDLENEAMIKAGVLSQDAAKLNKWRKERKVADDLKAAARKRQKDARNK